jgi:predicted dehydrogenase
MKNIKIGVFGAGSGADIAQNFMLLGCDIVAICDFQARRREDAAKRLGGDSVKQFEDFDEFIKEDMDAVILANYFHEHTPYAIKCFERGIHVFCECISNATMAEGVELIRAFEKSNSVYMLAENYPQMLFNREIKRLCDGGNSVIVIEHNLDMIKTADYIIDLGPEGGEGGGQIVAAGTPEKVAECEKSYTGYYLKNILNKND